MMLHPQKKMLFHGLDVPSPSPSRCVVNSFIRPEAEAASAAKSGACSRLSFLETKRRLSKGKNLGKTGKTLGTTWENLRKLGKPWEKLGKPENGKNQTNWENHWSPENVKTMGKLIYLILSCLHANYIPRMLPLYPHYYHDLSCGLEIQVVSPKNSFGISTPTFLSPSLPQTTFYKL